MNYFAVSYRDADNFMIFLHAEGCKLSFQSSHLVHSVIVTNTFSPELFMMICLKFPITAVTSPEIIRKHNSYGATISVEKYIDMINR